ncbi:MAG: acyl-CoA dehydrogenase family protein [Acidimicrobiales bacterium]
MISEPDRELDELRLLLTELLPSGWVDAAVRGDEHAVRAHRDQIDNPSLVRVLGRAGWISPHWPTGQGGRGLAIEAARAVVDLLDDWQVPRVPRGSGLSLAAPTIIEWADEATKERLLPPIASGEERWCQLFSEPGAGSDMASLATTAVLDGDEWVVNGQKVWTTYGHESEFAMLIARTDPRAPKHRGITYFGLDMRQDGVDVRPLVNMAGDLEFNEVFLTDTRVPDLYRISPVGEGWAAAMTTLGAERHALSGAKKKRKASDEILGGMTVDQVIELARELELTGDHVIRNRLARAWSDSKVLEWTVQRGRDRRAAGHGAGSEGSVTKIAKAVTNQSLQVLAVDLLGARAQACDRGDVAEEFVHEFLRTRANSIEGGNYEIQRNIVGERVLGLPREPDPYKGRPWHDVPRG